MNFSMVCRRVLILAGISALAGSGDLIAEEEPTADQVLRLVRMSYKGQDYQLSGALRDDDSGRSEPFVLTMQQQVIRFRFSNPAEIVNLDLATSPASLTLVQAGGKAAVPLAQYGAGVRSMALNYEDLSLRFIYWPNGKMLGTGSVKGQNCWMVRVSNPDGRGPYGTVDLWVHQGSGGVAKMEAYDFQGKLVKRFQVISVQKYQGETVLKEMRVEAFDANTQKIVGRTYMKLDKDG